MRLDHYLFQVTVRHLIRLPRLDLVARISMLYKSSLQDISVMSYVFVNCDQTDPFCVCSTSFMFTKTHSSKIPLISASSNMNVSNSTAVLSKAQLVLSTVFRDRRFYASPQSQERHMSLQLDILQTGMLLLLKITYEATKKSIALFLLDIQLTVF